MALDRLRRSPGEIGEEFWPTRAKKTAHSPNSKKAVESEESEVEAPAPEQVPQKDSKEGVWSG